MALHSRFMVCTALTLINPVFVRLLIWIYPTPPFLYQWITFGLTDAVFLALIWRDRHTRAGRWVFAAMLLVFVASQLVPCSTAAQSTSLGSLHAMVRGASVDISPEVGWGSVPVCGSRRGRRQAECCGKTRGSRYGWNSGSARGDASGSRRSRQERRRLKIEGCRP